MIFTWVDFKQTKYGDYVFPAGFDTLGWLITLASMVAVPAVALIKILTKHRDLPILQVSANNGFLLLLHKHKQYFGP